jgi:hypothetical protein
MVTRTGSLGNTYQSGRLLGSRISRSALQPEVLTHKQIFPSEFIVCKCMSPLVGFDTNYQPQRVHRVVCARARKNVPVRSEGAGVKPGRQLCPAQISLKSLAIRLAVLILRSQFFCGGPRRQFGEKFSFCACEYR